MKVIFQIIFLGFKLFLQPGRRLPILVFLLGCIQISTSSIAQEGKNYSFNIEPKVHYGFIIPHRTGIKNLIKGHVKGFELNYDIPTFGEKKWQQLYHYPTWGFSFYFADLANPLQLGFATGIFPYINFSTIKKDIFNLNFHLGWGVGYISKPFNRIENYKNIIIGSKINAIISLGCEAEWKLTNRISASSGISLTHFSNGAFTIPNLGINIPTANAGLSCYFGKVGKSLIIDSVTAKNGKKEISYFAAGGLRAVYPLGSTEKYAAFSMGITFALLSSVKNQFLVGYDLFYNTAHYDYFKRAKIILKNQFENLQPGISLFYAARISRISIITGMGYYIYSKYKQDGPVYHRIGMRYQVTENIFANVTLKTHFFKADFSEWGIGYCFH